MKSKLEGKTLILGIGNVMKEDDGAGPTAIAKIKTQRLKSKKDVELLDGGVAPENYTSKIKQIKPDTLVIIDAIDFGAKAGSVRVMEAEEISNQSLSTHNISLKTFVNFLRGDLPKLKVWIVGIQPKQTNFGEGLSPEVEKAVDEICMSLV